VVLFKHKYSPYIIVFVAALGYFVDVFDLWLFANFRVQSLKDLGHSESEITYYGVILINCQQIGLLLGGVLWGVLGDKRGRASVLFGSIVLYSIGNLLNAFVTDVYQYAVLRFFTGIGLAGEIGAGITLVCEVLPKNKRGIGTMIVTTLGVAGAIGAALAGKYLEWRTSYFIGGCMGLSLLALRVFAHDSSVYKKMEQTEDVIRGSLKLLLIDRERFFRFMQCIFVGAPIYLTFGVFATFSPEIAKAIGVKDSIIVPDVMLMTSIGLTLGDLSAGLLSQFLKRRKLPIAIFLFISLILSFTLVRGYLYDQKVFLYSMGILGFFGGYWACLLTLSAEQFGTNLRATATTMIPNLVRSLMIPLTLGFSILNQHMAVPDSLVVLIVISYGIAGASLFSLKETFFRDLDFYEK
jgi:MFS transporter, putative metabolite:H+ symporter